MRFLILSAFLTMGATLFSQEKVQWTIKSIPAQDNLTNIKIHAEIQTGWHIYSVKNPENAKNRRKVGFRFLTIRRRRRREKIKDLE